MKIYTKGGDKGKTSLLGGKRVSKAHVRIQAYGTVDELNSHLGLLTDQPVNSSQEALLRDIQHNLFVIGSLLAADDPRDREKLPALEDKHVSLLEQAIDKMDQQLPELRSFLLPGGHQSVSFCHIARCVCRRAERAVIELAEEAAVEEVLIRYLNRLSDFLFVLARYMALQLEVPEIPWNPKQ
ncbi:MAG: cob(I)yrinic acid a,c-diamide adenosyltransferase [Cyclobacteriaceae bacterium]|nr:cob(I)yrinic acid a,c-diamide adenosyltransferase [Cyclobacteriaceae bacterium]